MVLLTDELRRRRAKEQRGLCFYCFLRLHDDQTWEHLVPRCHGGRDTQANVRVTHARCNSEVGSLPVAVKFALHDIGRELGSDAFFVLVARLKPWANAHGADLGVVRARRPKRPSAPRHSAMLSRLEAQLPRELARAKAA